MRVRAFAPGTVANLGPGLDVLGLALTGAGDSVSAERSPEKAIRIRDSGHPEIPTEASRNTAGIAAAKVLERAGAPGMGVLLDVSKGLPLSGGQGGSAASAAASAVAVNALLGSPLSREDLLDACLDAEEAVAGRHADNVAAALFGGVILVRALDPPDIVRLRYPAWLRVVLLEPDQRLRTEQARAALPRSVDRGLAMEQAAQVGALVAALAAGDLALLGRAVRDRIAEPARTPLLPGFAEAKSAALEAGAHGCSISGAGPAVFAFAADDESASRIGNAMGAAYERRGISARFGVRRIDSEGARVVES